MSHDEESTPDAPPPCDNGVCDSADDCTCWTCEMCDQMQADGVEVFGHAGPVCEDCWDEAVTTCDVCSSYALTDAYSARDCNTLGVWNEMVHTDCGTSACSDCAVPCDECGSLWCSHEEAAECCGGAEAVHDYSYRPSPRFWDAFASAPAWRNSPTGRALYVGVEIEAEHAADSADQFLADAGEDPGAEQFVYLKRDGSLGSGGVEIVTHPATPDAFLRRFPFAALDAWAARGARSYRRPACGMHIHVSRSAFTPTHLWRFVRFQLANVEQCIRMAQRESAQWAEWSGEGMDEVKKSLPAMVKGQKRNGRRYVAINFQNRATVELRYFKGNLSSRIIRRQVLFVQAMYEYTRRMTLADVQGGAFDWQRFVDWTANDPVYAELTPAL